jgi:nicotinamide-nucleotide amidase
MDSLIPLAEKIAAVLKERGETIAIAESSTGGLISAALLAIPGASAYFLGGAVVYTVKARRELLGIADVAMVGVRGASEQYAQIMARAVRQRFASSWSLGETGATGPTGNRYGDAAGHTCIAIDGAVERAVTLETGKSDRVANMRTFAAAALDLLAQSLAAASPRA